MYNRVLRLHISRGLAYQTIYVLDICKNNTTYSYLDIITDLDTPYSKKLLPTD